MSSIIKGYLARFPVQTLPKNKNIQPEKNFYIPWNRNFLLQN